MAATEEASIFPSVIGLHVWPPSVVFHRPPPAAPNQYSFGREELPATAVERPPRDGPTMLHSSEP